MSKVKLFQYKPMYGILNPSPYCMKVELFLKLGNIDYEVEILQNPSQAPHKKLPYIELDGELTPDSRVIIPLLAERFGVDFNEGLSEYQRGVGKCLERTFDDGLYWEIFRLRWSDEESWCVIKKELFSAMPLFLKPFLPAMIRKQVLKQQWHQGVGRLSREDVVKLGQETLHAVSAVLGANKFMLGDRLALCDITAYAYLANIGSKEIGGLLCECLHRYDNLKQYLHTMQSVVNSEPVQTLKAS